MKLTFDTEAQDIVPGQVYTDGKIVFTAHRVAPITLTAMVVVTRTGRRILTSNTTKVAPINK